MLNVIMLNVIMLNVIMLNVIMLNVIMLNVIMLSVVAPSKPLGESEKQLRNEKRMVLKGTDVAKSLKHPIDFHPLSPWPGLAWPTQRKNKTFLLYIHRNLTHIECSCSSLKTL
jgi:hypothetical protein